MSELRKHIEQARKMQKVGAWTIGGLVILFYLAVYRPQTNKLTALKADIVHELGQLGTNKSKTSGLSQLEQQVQIMRDRLDRYNRRLPKSEDLGQFIREIEVIRRESLIPPFTYAPGQPKHNEQVTELPINFTLEGDYLSVARFLLKTEEMQRLTRVRSLSIRSLDSKKPGRVGVQMSMNIYYAEAK